jgi:hypothetical protein
MERRNLSGGAAAAAPAQRRRATIEASRVNRLFIGDAPQDGGFGKG